MAAKSIPLRLSEVLGSFVFLLNTTDDALCWYVLSTMGVSKKSISKFLIGNRCHVKLRILIPYSNRIRFYRILFEKDSISDSIRKRFYRI